MYLTFSQKLVNVINESSLLDDKTYHYHSVFIRNFKNVKGIVIWKAHRKKSIVFAQRYNLPLIQIEDAFIGYLEDTHGKMVNIGFYYDSSGKVYYSGKGGNIISTTLETKDYTQENLQETSLLIEKIVLHKITKFNKTTQPQFIPTQNTAPILLIDQLLGDNSITVNGHGTNEFQRMYEQAMRLAKAKYNGEKIYIKTHPKGRGYLQAIAKKDDVVFLNEDYNIYDILLHVDEVFTVSSQVGFEALLSRKTVHTFGMPFYAGYGLTNDDIKTNRPKRSIEEVFYASYIKACRYFIAKREYNLDKILDVISEHKRLTQMDNQIDRFFFYKIPLWKMPHVVSFLFKKNLKITRVKNKKSLEKYVPTSNDAVVVWGFKGECEMLLSYTENHNIPIITFEDGFIRSVGLGSDFITPYSLVMDRYGIYYNPQQTSELEVILSNFTITPEQKTRVRNLQRMIVQHKITKYNVDKKDSQKTLEEIKQNAQGRRIILIAGQVSDDMSIIKGGVMISDCRTLTEKVRQENPDAFIVYKHHPDVIANNRKGYISSHILRKYADVILKDINIADVIQIADELHTITSLAGFEALLYGKKVVHYGLPFYGGYGFTENKSSIYTRKVIDFDTFCYAILLLYPRYAVSNIRIALTPEIIIKTLKDHHKRIIKKQNFFIRKIEQIIRLCMLYCK
jgi:capsular polysaccharide export protein